jgi:hypothetical protein
MHPNTYLRPLWRAETLDQVFVAMSFEVRFEERYRDIIKPAIEGSPIAGRRLAAYKVDNSMTGDSILTDIADGIAHSAVILADVSVIDEGRFTGYPIRNGNVMYEVGMALSCRLPSEVLLIRDDEKRFLFDVSTIPHMTVDFKDKGDATERIRAALHDRLTETRRIYDARVSIASRRLTPLELQVLEGFAKHGPGVAQDFANKATGMLSIPMERAIAALLEKGCIQSAGRNVETQGLFYHMTPFGRDVAASGISTLPMLKPKPKDA